MSILTHFIAATAGACLGFMAAVLCFVAKEDE